MIKLLEQILLAVFIGPILLFSRFHVTTEVNEWLISLDQFIVGHTDDL